MKSYFICVDDEQSVIETLREQLREHFKETHEVEVAISAEDALRLIEDITSSGGKLEVVITDQVMPGMKGDKFLEVVAKKHPECIKILLTGQATLPDAIYAINKGGLNLYVEKPWDMDNLKEDIERLVKKYRQNIENQRILHELEDRISVLEKGSEEIRSRLD